MSEQDVRDDVPPAPDDETWQMGDTLDPEERREEELPEEERVHTDVERPDDPERQEEHAPEERPVDPPVGPPLVP